MKRAHNKSRESRLRAQADRNLICKLQAKESKPQLLGTGKPGEESVENAFNEPQTDKEVAKLLVAIGKCLTDFRVPAKRAKGKKNHRKLSGGSIKLI